jgi:hypothetical protein
MQTKDTTIAHNGENSTQITPKKPKRLTQKQQKFVQAYVNTGNATEAALQVYDVASRDVANAVGGENLAKPIIRGAIEACANTIRDSINNTLARNNTIAQVLDRLHAMALGDDPRASVDAIKLIKEYSALGMGKDATVDNRKILINYPKA